MINKPSQASYRLSCHYPKNERIADNGIKIGVEIEDKERKRITANHVYFALVNKNVRSNTVLLYLHASSRVGYGVILLEVAAEKSLTKHRLELLARYLVGSTFTIARYLQNMIKHGEKIVESWITRPLFVLIIA